MLEAAIVIGGVVNGPIIGIFTAGYPQLQFKCCYGTIIVIFNIFPLIATFPGMLLPWVDSRGALTGSSF